MTPVITISKRGAVTLPPAMRRKFGFGAGNPLVLIEERDGNRASAVSVKKISEHVIQGWIVED